MPDDKKMSRQGRDWLTRLFAEAFADRSSVEPAVYATLNAAVGLAVLVLANLVFDTRREGAVVLGVCGLVLGSGLLVRRAHPRVLVKALRVHGVTLAFLGVRLAASSVHWALWAPPETPFRYGPGLILTLLTCAGLELAWVPDTPISARRLRRGGLWLGMVLELVVLVALGVRANR